MPFKNSDELRRDLQLKLRPWLMTIPVPSASPTPDWTAKAEEAVKYAVGSQLQLYLRDGVLPSACLGAYADGSPKAEERWACQVTRPIRVSLSRYAENSGFDPFAPTQIQVQNLGNVAELVMQPLYRVNVPITEEAIADLTPRTPVADFVQNIMGIVRNRGAEDNFTLDSETRALQEAIQPANTFRDRRRMLEEARQIAFQKENEAKKEAEDKKAAIDATGFGRLIDID